LRGGRSSSWAVQSVQKWNEWLWSDRMTAEILLTYLDVAGRNPWNNQL
jgi:hypothetical protein